MAVLGQGLPKMAVYYCHRRQANALLLNKDAENSGQL